MGNVGVLIICGGVMVDNGDIVLVDENGVVVLDFVMVVVYVEMVLKM